ncbi:Acidic endochitinase Q [Morella rubra]|uniref:chitinase n=1 Tax=Morella rubra TaxID=262757 RepID=A0A6A1V376_9ROSI|nr:Acidic endochitinase Q [Morella rubra]
MSDKGFYTYKGFLDAARSFDGFGTTGDDAIRKREIAAFLAQTSYETRASEAIGADLLTNPDLGATDATISFKTAIWFWMTPQGNKPSSHDVIIGKWTPSAEGIEAGRV